MRYLEFSALVRIARSETYYTKFPIQFFFQYDTRELIKYNKDLYGENALDNDVHLLQLEDEWQYDINDKILCVYCQEMTDQVNPDNNVPPSW